MINVNWIQAKTGENKKKSKYKVAMSLFFVGYAGHPTTITEIERGKRHEKKYANDKEEKSFACGFTIAKHFSLQTNIGARKNI